VTAKANRARAGSAEVAGGLAFAAAGGAMVALPLIRRGRRAVLADVVVAGLAGAAISIAHRGWGRRRAFSAFAVVVGGATAIERFGVTTGVPFGAYRYTPALRPQVAGLPLAVPLAWFAMGLPAREAAGAVVGQRGIAARVALGAACLTAWDLFLDPQMVGEGYWSWRRPGRYRGIPWTNFAGWLLAGAAVMGLLELVLPPASAASIGPSAAAVGVYGWMAVMQTLGAAAFDRDLVVAAAGGLAMLPVAAMAAQRVAAARRG
jgi:putative membrane protein